MGARLVRFELQGLSCVIQRLVQPAGSPLHFRQLPVKERTLRR